MTTYERLSASMEVLSEVINYSRRLHRGSEKNAPVLATQPGQKYNFAPATLNTSFLH